MRNLGLNKVFLCKVSGVEPQYYGVSKDLKKLLIGAGYFCIASSQVWCMTCTFLVVSSFNYSRNEALFSSNSAFDFWGTVCFLVNINKFQCWRI